MWKIRLQGDISIIRCVGSVSTFCYTMYFFPLMNSSTFPFKSLNQNSLTNIVSSIPFSFPHHPQLANIYITVTAGAIWTTIQKEINHPQELLLILGETLPKMCGYFISLLLTKILAGLPLILLRMGALFHMAFLKGCFNKKRLTQRELDEVYRKEPIAYGWEVRAFLFFAVDKFIVSCHHLTLSPTLIFSGNLLQLIHAISTQPSSSSSSSASPTHA